MRYRFFYKTKGDVIVKKITSYNLKYEYKYVAEQHKHLFRFLKLYLICRNIENNSMLQFSIVSYFKDWSFVAKYDSEGNDDYYPDAIDKTNKPSSSDLMTSTTTINLDDVTLDDEEGSNLLYHFKKKNEDKITTIGQSEFDSEFSKAYCKYCFWMTLFNHCFKCCHVLGDSVTPQAELKFVCFANGWTFVRVSVAEEEENNNPKKSLLNK